MIMASLRGGDFLWGSATAAAAGVAQNAVSEISMPGDAPYVAVFIKCDQAATFKVQAGGAASPTAGLNSLTSAADGGLVWFDYWAPLGTGQVTITFAGSGQICQSLAPYAPQYIRLIRTDGGTAANVTAFLTSVGPN